MRTANILFGKASICDTDTMMRILILQTSNWVRRRQSIEAVVHGNYPDNLLLLGIEYRLDYRTLQTVLKFLFQDNLTKYVLLRTTISSSL